MARRISKKCQHCAILPVEEAIALHGPVGDPDTLPEKKALALYGRKGEACWNPATCHRKRSHYRKRDDNNRTRRRMYRQSKLAVAESTAIEQGQVQPIATDPDTFHELLPQPATA